MNVGLLLAVLLGGLLGGLARGLLTRTFAPREPGGLPRGVLLCNLVGSFLLGLLTPLLLPGSSAAALAGIGFCGGLTTWSTFSLDLVVLARVSRRRALLYLALTLVPGLLAAGAGLALSPALGLLLGGGVGSR